MGTSFDIVQEFPRVPASLVSRASEFQPAILADVNGRRGALHGRIAALRPRMKLAGNAFTVDVRPGDNLMIHAAMALAKPGDVLVIDGKGDQTAALMGTIMMTACKQLGSRALSWTAPCATAWRSTRWISRSFPWGRIPTGQPSRSADALVIQSPWVA